MSTPQLPDPNDLFTQYDTGQIDQRELNRQFCRHLSVLYNLKELDLLIVNGLLQDMAAVAAELQLDRPSEAMRQRLKAWVQQSNPE
jgi:hypothetical protein